MGEEKHCMQPSKAETIRVSFKRLVHKHAQQLEFVDSPKTPIGTGTDHNH